MTIRAMEELITGHDVFAGLASGYLELIAGCGRNEAIEAGRYLFREGDPADRFFLVRRGRVAIAAHVPGRPPVIIDTIEEGDLVGWSWLFPPHRWAFDGQATAPVGVVAFDGGCLRAKCDADPRLGYELMGRFAGVLARRLNAARLHLLDLYGDGDGA